MLHDHGCAAAFRINGPWLLALPDIVAAVAAKIDAIVVLKTEAVEALATISDIVGEHEAATGRPAGTIGLIALIESPAALNVFGATAAICPAG